MCSPMAGMGNGSIPFVEYLKRGPAIRCAVCNRPVQRAEANCSFNTDTIHIRVWCHGSTDECDVTR